MDDTGPVTIPPPGGVVAEPFSPGKLWRLAAVFGPAAVVASVAIGAGETIIVVEAGSWAAYDLLWLVLLSVLVKGICVTYLLGRYTAVSGEAIGHRLVHFPGPRGWLLLAIVAFELAAAGPLWAAIARPWGDLVYHLITQVVPPDGAGIGVLGIGRDAWTASLATAFVVFILLVGVRQSYERLERQQLVICGILVGGTILGTLLVRPDLAAAARGLARFGRLPEVIPPWAPAAVQEQPLLTMATTFGYVGGTVMGYVAYAHWIGLHRWGLCGHDEIETIRRRAARGMPGDYLPDDAAAVARLRRSLSPLRWDVGLGAVVLLLVTTSFMTAGAAVLYPRLASGEIESAFQGWSLLTDQASIWRNIHPWLTGVYYICVLAALWGTMCAFPEIYTRVTHEFFTAIWPDREWSFSRMQVAISVYVLLATLPMLWIDVDFATVSAIVAFLATNVSVALALIAALFLNFQLPPRYRTRWWMLAACLASAAILIVVSLVSGWGLWQRFVAS